MCMDACRVTAAVCDAATLHLPDTDVRKQRGGDFVRLGTDIADAVPNARAWAEALAAGADPIGERVALILSPEDVNLLGLALRDAGNMASSASASDAKLKNSWAAGMLHTCDLLIWGAR